MTLRRATVALPAIVVDLAATLTAAFVAIFGITAASAQQATPPIPQPRPAPTATYRIAGKVIDAHTGVALSRSSVRIADVKERSQSRTVTSGDDGAFSFAGLARGKYSLTAEHRGYLAQAYEEHEQYSTAIAVGPSLDSENILFKLTAEGVIAGTITDEAGEPVRGAQVRLFEDVDTTGIRTTQQRQTVNTDDRGRYEIAALRPGSYFLVVTAHPWYAQRLRQPLVNDASAQDNPTTQAQSSALDVAYPTTYYPGVADQDAATPIPIKGGERLEANLTLTAQPAIRLRVKMPSQGEDGNQIGGSVMLSQTIFGQVEPMPMQMTGGPGGFEVEGVLPGHYDVTLNQYTPGQNQSVSKHFSTDIGSGATELSENTGIDSITVTGKVIAETGKLPANSGMSLRTPNTRRTQYGALNEAGEFTIEAPPGAYEIIGNITGMHISGMKATGSPLAGRMLTVKAGDAPKLEITMGSGHGEIEGIATHNGKPASAVMVLLAPEDPKNNQVLFRRDQSDSDGTFDLTNIFPGRYRLLAIEEGWQLEWANPAVLQAFLAKSIPIEVKSGDHLDQKIEVQSR